MIPQGYDTEYEVLNDMGTTKTYKLHQDKIQGFTDGLDALYQAVFKMLQTEQYEHAIYPFGYGMEYESLIGKDRIYVQAELKRRFRECLLQDDRIISVDNFRFTASGDTLTCEFDVTSIYGVLNITQEVTV